MTEGPVGAPPGERTEWLPAEFRRYAFRVIVYLYLPTAVLSALVLLIMGVEHLLESQIGTIAEGYHGRGLEPPLLFQYAVWVGNVIVRYVPNFFVLATLIALVGLRLGWRLGRTTLLAVVTVIAVTLVCVRLFP